MPRVRCCLRSAVWPPSMAPIRSPSRAPTSNFQEDGLIQVQRGVGMFVCEGAATRLLATERAIFLDEEWPAIKQRIARLGLRLEDLAQPDKRFPARL